MQTVSPGQQRTMHERACVLFDRKSGAIRHIQHVIVMEGGHNPDEREIEAMCRTSLSKRGQPHDHLDALHLERSALAPMKVYRVDPARRVLVEQPMPKGQGR